MSVQLKFCGLTRPEDVAQAELLGAEYMGVIFAGGPRERTLEQAVLLFARNAAGRRVGVFGRAEQASMRSAIVGVRLDVVQLHGDPTASAVSAARGAGATEVWAVAQIQGGELPEGAEQLFLHTDAVVLDTKGAAGLGGTGRVFDWDAVAAALAGVRRRGRLVVAGGLNPQNVASAIRALRPDVVDVSSGVESAPGVKDHSLMRRFADAARSA